MAEDIVEIVKIEIAGNVEDIVKIIISVIISNSQILDMYGIFRSTLYLWKTLDFHLYFYKVIHR